MFLALLPAIGLAEPLRSGGKDTSYINYIQNKGQWNNKVLFQGDFRGGRVFLEHSSFMYLFYPAGGLGQHHAHEKKTADSSLSFHAVRMEFDGADPNHPIATQNTCPFYHNYFQGNDPRKWASNVPLYNVVLHKNMYPGIDVKVFGRGNNLRYDFIVSPGADPSAISLKFTGQDRLWLRNGKVMMLTSVGEIIQEAPYAYQLAGGREKPVPCEYVLKENKIAISITGPYDHSLPLIIDPTIVFSTYTGSGSDNWGMSASFDHLGNAYTAGIVDGPLYPITTGAFQTNYSGGYWDIALSKFDPIGASLIFSTYLGGSSVEMPQSITVDHNNCLIVLGRTYSTDFPVVNGCFSTFNSGGTDIIVTKFNPSGTSLLASTYIGGSGNDGINITDHTTRGSLKHNYSDDARGAVHVDELDNIYVAATTASTNFPVTAGCVQPLSGGAQDACVFKFNPSLTTLLFSTYLGGSANDAGYNLAIDSQNNIYVTGGTESTNFPVTPGVLHTSYQGNIDGFVTHLSSSGNVLLQSTYIGTNAYEQSYFVQTDKNNNVYLFGQCSGNYPITAGTYSVANSGQFLHKIDPTLSATFFSTEFGSGSGYPDIVPSAFLVDNCQHLYISGWGGTINNITSSTSGLPVTINAFQDSTDGNDFYFAAFKKDVTALQYATFFGGAKSAEHVDGGTSCFDKTGMCYQAICASCGGLQDMPTTPGAWSGVNSSNNCNTGLVKFQMNLLNTLARANLSVPSRTGCAPFTVGFMNYSANAVDYYWDFGDGNSSTAVNPSHTYFAAGTYTVLLIAKDSTTCNMIDTTSLILTVLSPGPIVPQIAPGKICKGKSISLNINYPSAASYSWQPAGSLSNSTIQSPLAFPLASTIYTLTLTDSLCNVAETRTVLVEVMTNTTLIVPSHSTSCHFEALVLSTNTVFASYYWGSGKTSPTLSLSPFAAGLYTVSTVDFFGCQGFDSLRIFRPVPIAPASQKICEGGTAQLLAPFGAYQYSWQPGQHLSNPWVFNPTASPLSTVIYTLSILNGTCLSSNTQTLTVELNPKVQIVNTRVDFCTLDTVTLKTDKPFVSYAWSTSDSGPTIKIISSGLYSVVVTNDNGCSASDSMRVKIYPPMNVSSSVNTICQGQGMQLFAPTGNYTYRWHPSSFLSSASISNPVANPPSSVVYTLILSNGICISSVHHSLIVNPSPLLKLNLNKTLLIPGESVGLAATSTSQCTWYPGYGLSCVECSAPIASPDESTTYYCYTENQFGCASSASVLVEVMPTFYIPNTFTPNSDGLNELFRPAFSGYIELSMNIFNRWGELIYSTNALDGGWDGYFKGKPAELGAYVYRIIATDYKHQKIERTGPLILLR